MALWIAQICSVLAIHVVNFTLVIKIFQVTNSAFMISLLMVAISLPGIIWVPVAGALADRLDRRKILLVANIIQALTTLGYILWLQNIWALLAVAFINSIIAQTYSPTEGATLPTLVGQEDLIGANSLFTMTLYGGFILGYTMAGPIVILGGLNFPFYISSAFLIIAALATLFLPPDSGKKTLSIQVAKAFDELKTDIGHGINYIRRSPKVLFPALRFTFALTLLYVALVIFPSFAQKELGIEISDLSHVLIGPLGIGLILGTFVTGSFIKKFKGHVTVNIGLVLAGVSLISVTYYQHLKVLEKFIPFHGLSIGLLPIASFLIIFAGIGAALILIPTQTEIQSAVQSRFLGRVWGTIYLASNVINVPLVLLAGTLVDLISPKIIVIIMATIVIVFGVKNWIFYLLDKYLNITEIVLPRS